MDYTSILKIIKELLMEIPTWLFVAVLLTLFGIVLDRRLSDILEALK